MCKLYLPNFMSIIVLIPFITILFPINQSFAQNAIVPGVIQHHETDQEIIWDWYTYVPEDFNFSKKGYLLVFAATAVDYNFAKEIADVDTWWRGKNYSEGNQLIILGAALPYGEIYPSTFDRQSFWESTDPFYQRADLKINLMIDRFTEKLSSAGYDMHQKVFVDGYSSGGAFAFGYSVLHPDRVQAVSAGGIGFVNLPLIEYNGEVLDWPIGTNDYYSLMGKEFDFETFKNIPIFVYVGENDTVWFNDTVHGNSPLFWENESQPIFLNIVFGDTLPIRVKNQTDLLIGLGCNLKFKMYIGLGHDDISFYKSPEIYINDVLSFINQQKEIENTGDNENGGSGGGGGLGCFVNTLRPGD